jgi:hypothetical protein
MACLKKVVCIQKKQDGEKLYKVMLESKKYLKNPPRWQYIIFSYNEHNVEKAKQMAQKRWC